jgi:hypothetical protein
MSGHGTDRTQRRRPVPADTSDPGQQLNQLVASLHACVDLVDRVRARRIRGVGALLALNLADLATTSWFLALGGVEGNPVLAPVVERWWIILLVKVVIVTVLGRRVLAAPPRSAEASWLVRFALAYYVLVVAWNLTVVARI